jgi:hypothetical protein
MALPSSGEIRMSQINAELGRASNLQISLDAAENNGYAIINQCSISRPSGNNPASMSEWRGYNHAASCSGLPTYHLGYAQLSNPWSFTWNSRIDCDGGQLVNVGGNISIYYTVQRTTNGVTVAEDYTSVIPAGQNSAPAITMPAGTTAASIINIISYYISGFDANLVMCVQSTQTIIYLVVGVVVPSFATRWSARSSCAGNLVQVPSDVTINYRILRYFGDGTTQETSYTSVIPAGQSQSPSVESAVVPVGASVTVDSYSIAGNLAQLYMCS